MRLSGVEALGRLVRLGKPVVTTADVSLRLRQTRSAASRALGRLAKAGLVLPLRRGLWSLDPSIEPLALPEHLTAPFPAYVSLQSALHLHGMIGQIPQVVYVASLAPTRRVKTRVGTYSIHRLAPSFFGGFDTLDTGVRLARPAKALLDVLYLTPARSRLFARLPEIELPRAFSLSEAREWIARIPSGLRKRAVEQRFDALVSGARLERGPRARRASSRPRGPSRASRAPRA